MEPSTIAGDVARLAVGLVFIVAGAAKLKGASQLQTLTRAVGNLLGVQRHRWLGSLLILAELALGALLIMGVGGRVTLAAAGAVLVGFTIVLRALARRGYDSSCSCFGPGSGRLTGTLPLARNAVLCALLVVAGAAADRSFDAPWAVEPEASGLAAAVFGVLAIVHRLAGQVLHLAQGPDSLAVRRDTRNG